MGVLSGVRVIDMGLWVAGPAAGGIMADWGADVVKIEMPTGDPMRNLFGALSGSKEARCPPFDLYNRGKQSIALDVNRPEGRDLAARLVAGADVFLTNMRPQFLKRVGLDHDTLMAKNPRLLPPGLHWTPRVSQGAGPGHRPATRVGTGLQPHPVCPAAGVGGGPGEHPDPGRIRSQATARPGTGVPIRLEAAAPAFAAATGSDLIVRRHGGPRH